jgi:tRNA A37 threonylcarbamoyladenosine modification protein TsaB
VAASVAKALVWNRAVEWLVGPSLLLRAMGVLSPGNSVILSLSDALRGELYAGCWRISDSEVVPVGRGISTLKPSELASFGPVDKVVGSIPEPLLAEVAEVTGREPLSGAAALPDARAFFALAVRAGALSRISDVHGWQPQYGRPAEAQAVWERKHGRPLPAPTHHKS